MITVYLVRHGQSKGNEDKGEYDRTPDCLVELTEKGKKQADITGSRIKDHLLKHSPYPYIKPRVRFITSPYRRAVQTTDIVKTVVTGRDEVILGSVREDPRIREREWGHWNPTHAELCTKDPTAAFFSILAHRRESLAEVYDRVSGFDMWLRDSMLRQECQAGGSIVIVAHGELIQVYKGYLEASTVSEIALSDHPRNGQVCELQYTYNEGTGLIDFATSSYWTAPYVKSSSE